MVMTLHETWGICIPPPARVRNDPLPDDWTNFSSGGMTVPKERSIIGGSLPAEHEPAWFAVSVKLAEIFVRLVGGRLNPPVQASALRIAHPHNEAKVEAVRTVHNGDMPEPEGGCLPRVWRWEHEDQVF